MKDYSVFPEGMAPDEVAREFEALLAEATSHEPPSDLEIASALYVLADRQWHTYRLLRDDLREAVAAWLDSHWNDSSSEYVEHVICSIGRLGLQRLMPKIQAGIDQRAQADVPEILREYWSETQGDVSDPFRSMS